MMWESQINFKGEADFSHFNYAGDLFWFNEGFAEAGVMCHGPCYFFAPNLTDS